MNSSPKPRGHLVELMGHGHRVFAPQTLMGCANRLKREAVQLANVSVQGYTIQQLTDPEYRLYYHGELIPGTHHGVHEVIRHLLQRQQRGKL